MKASLRSVRIAPKKANLVAGLIRGLPVAEAQLTLERTNKKAARILEELLKSAVANARNNDNQAPDALVVSSLVVNKAQAYHRGVPMARGRVRPMRKFLSHIHLTLGIMDENEVLYDSASTKLSTGAVEKKSAKKTTESASQTAKKPVKTEAKKSAKGASAKDTTASAKASSRPKTATAKKATPKKATS